jgi:hypothetical protein
VKTRIDARFVEESQRFSLCFTCEHCAYFALEDGACANGYPNDAHREAALYEADELDFCKEFELA